MRSPDTGLKLYVPESPHAMKQAQIRSARKSPPTSPRLDADRFVFNQISKPHALPPVPAPLGTPPPATPRGGAPYAPGPGDAEQMTPRNTALARARAARGAAVRV
mmetsp:Transcript_18075/g.50786  ORF Transcript_18075/g.50786 Transcript_18075/m.50786 type:complete len:105 (-) Transcript_18075:348-662(-)